MEFVLPFQIQPYSFTISYTDKILLIGSCFSENIGDQMKELKLNIFQNPNGILYDPVSISESLLSYIDNKSVAEDDLFELNGLWHSWKHHSVFSEVNKNEVLVKINQSRSAAHAFLKEAKLLIVTLATSYQYQLKKNSQSVANCHKAPTSFFEKILLPVEETVSALSAALDQLKVFNQGLKIIFTISPVKHVKDGVVENNLSKARLIEAVHSLVQNKEDVFYFPSYELVTDVLRDYRFYKEDLVHPNETAVNFVFEKFCDTLLDDESKQILKKIRNIMNAVNHRPFLKGSEAHQKFMSSQLANILHLEREYPFIDFSDEKKYFGG